jgi:beta-phosphoglucomutase-like phosphatase (HAD superfamily)
MHKLGFIVDMDGTMIDSMGYHAHPLPKVLEMTTGRTCVECMDLLFERPYDCQEGLDDVHHSKSLYRDLFESEFRELKGFKAFIAHVTERGIPWAAGTAGDKIVW